MMLFAQAINLAFSYQLLRSTRFSNSDFFVSFKTISKNKQAKKVNREKVELPPVMKLRGAFWAWLFILSTFLGDI